MQRYCHKRQGSVFFAIVLFLMVASSIVYSLHRSTSCLLSLVREREKSEKQYYLAYALGSFVRSSYKTNEMSSMEQKTRLFKGSWPDEKSGYKGYAWRAQKKDKKMLFIELMHQKTKVVTLSYVL